MRSPSYYVYEIVTKCIQSLHEHYMVGGVITKHQKRAKSMLHYRKPRYEGWTPVENTWTPSCFLRFIHAADGGEANLDE